MKTVVACVAVLWLFAASPPCTAQNVVEIIRLSADEAAKMKEAAEGLKSAEDRDNRARTSWHNVHQRYQAEHPELQRLTIASDFRVVFGVNNSGSEVQEAAVVELTAEERQQAESLHTEMLSAAQALVEARKNWQDRQHELVSDHFPSTKSGSTITLSSGKSVIIPYSWNSGLALTPDYRMAVPRR